MVNGSEVRSFTDTSAPDGTAYYRMAAMNSDTTGSQSSMSAGATLSTKANSVEMFLSFIAMGAIAILLIAFRVAMRRKEQQ